MTKPVHPVFTMTNVLRFESLMTGIIQYFMKRIDDQFVSTGKSCDIGLWLHLREYHSA